ncbi:hypothetical protein CRUP_034999 [Coryphaenoides rupestris]|nr:hypothetical protein CRUP_034999 [Coryphaenoides rupestris]
MEALRARDAELMAVPTDPGHLRVPAFWDSPLSHGINVFVGLVLCFTMLGLGCTVDIGQLGEQIRRPVGVLLALVCQFVVMPLLAFLLALAFSLEDVAAMAVLLCGCCPGGNLSNILSLLVNGEMNLSIIMTISSTLLALVLMPLCLWVYSRAWINTPVVELMPFGAIILTLCGTLLPIGLGVLLRHRYTRVADVLLKVSLWSLLVTLILLFILTGAMLGPALLSTIPPAVYVVAVLMPACGYAAGYGLATLFGLPPSSCRAVSMETGCQNVQLCTAILKLAFPPHLMGSMYMFPLLYALFQAAEAGVFILVYRAYRKEVLHKPDAANRGNGKGRGHRRLIPARPRVDKMASYEQSDTCCYSSYDDDNNNSSYYYHHNNNINNNPYRYHKPRDTVWRYRKSCFPPSAADAEAFRALLAQVNPALTPRMRRANTRDVAVQVNPRAHAAVQCALGPRTLPRLACKTRGDARLAGEPRGRVRQEGQGSPGQRSPVRYPRTLALYSPVAYRTFITARLPDDDDGGDDDVKDAASGDPPPPEEQGEQPEGEEPRVAEGGKGEEPRGAETSEAVKEEKCQKEFNPYRVEDITCHTCNKGRCSCAWTQRHVDPKRPHRQDLCGRCKGKRLSCESTFSYKYII